MTRRRAVLAAALVLAALLTANTISVSKATEQAKARDGGRVLRLETGDLNVKTRGDRSDPPVVLLHCFSCSLRWWEPVARDLARDHRVISIDLLGHGGSEKPGSGYSIPNQGRLVALALNRLGVEGATVAGQSMGGHVATALAEAASELVDRIAIFDAGAAPDQGELPITAKLGFVPVVGQTFWRLKLDFMIRQGLSRAFADGYDVPDFAVRDFREMTYSSYDASPGGVDDYIEERDLGDRLTALGVPVLAVMGAEDEIVDADEALRTYREIPGVRTRRIRGAGHTPQLEKPDEVAALIRRFARR